MSDLRIRLLTDLSQFKASMAEAMSSVRAAVGGMSQQFRQAGNDADQGARKAEGGFDGLAKKIGGLAAAYAALRTIQSLSKIADDATLTTARIQGLTGSVEQTRKAQAALYEMSQRLQAPYQEAANSFARMLPAVQQLGGGVAQTTRLTEILLTTAKLSGASAAEAAASATQFAQGLSSGVLQGDELKSILENNSTLARTLAGALGVTIGELRKMGTEGKLTADVVGNALLGSYDQVKSQAASLPATVGGAWTTIENAFAKLVTTVGSGTGVFGTLGKVLMEVAHVVEAFTSVLASSGKASNTLEQNKGATSFARNVGLAFAMMGDMVGAVVSMIVDSVGAALRIFGSIGTMIGAIGAAVELVAQGNFRGAGMVIVDAFQESGDAVVSLGTAIGENTAKMVLAFQGAGEGAKAYKKILSDIDAKAGAKEADEPVAKLKKSAPTSGANLAELKKAAEAEHRYKQLLIKQSLDDSESMLKEQEKLESDNAKAIQQIRQIEVQDARDALRARADAGEITRAEELQAEMALQQSIFDEQMRRLAEREAATRADAIAHNEVRNEIEVAEKDHNARMAQMDRQLTAERTENMRGMFANMQGGFQNVIQQFMKGQLTIKGLFQGLAAAVVDAMAGMVAKVIAQWMVAKIASLFFKKTEIAGDIARAGAGGVASMAAAPWPMNLTAPAFGASMAALAAGYMAIPAAAKGYDIPAGLNPITQLHEKEMVLPAEQADVIRGLADSGSGTGGGGSITVELKGASAGEFFIAHKSELVKAIKAAHRGFSFA